MQPTVGALLVAAPDLRDPNFADAVVLLVDVDDSGALGVVLNDATPILVADVLPPWADLVADPGRLHRGGPVGTDGALALGHLAPGAEAPVGWQPAFEAIGLVDLDTPVELVEDAVMALRVYAGYAGWGPDQLEAEIAEGSWYVVPSHPRDIFATDLDDLRRAVLRRQPGELAWASTRPADPLLN